MKKHELLLTAMLCVAAWPSTTMATDAGGGVQVALTAQRIVLDRNGKEVFAESQQARPGDILEYRAVYRNPGKRAVRNVLAVLPVPANGLSYVPASANPQRVWASLDGRTFALAPLTRTVTLPDGRREIRPVPVSEYRYLRWDLGELKPGAQAVVAARMRMAQAEQSAGGVK